MCNRPAKNFPGGLCGQLRGCLHWRFFINRELGPQWGGSVNSMGNLPPFRRNFLQTSEAQNANEPLALPLGRCCLLLQEVCVNQSLTGEIEHFILEARSLRTMTGISSFCPARAVCHRGDKSPGVGNKGYRELRNTEPWGEGGMGGGVMEEIYFNACH